MSSRKNVIFCDFDGTITINDNIIAIVRHFNPPGWEEIVGQIIDQNISIREGVGQLFALLPSSQREEIISFALGNMKIREGFAELLRYCRENGIEFYVTSGGIDFFVYPTLAPFSIPEDHIYCNGSDFSEESIRILWPHSCDEHCSGDCGMCKTTIIRSYPEESWNRILIGDSITDFAGAKLADVVFARSHLATECEKLGLSYHPYGDFYDVLEQLKSYVLPSVKEAR